MHAGLDLGFYLALATTVQHVRPVAILSDVGNNVDMFVFCLGLVGSHVLSIGRVIEVIVSIRVFRTSGLHEESVVAMQKELIWYAGPTMFYAAAMIYSGVKHFGSSEDTPYDESYAGPSPSDDHRVLASTSSSFYSTGSKSDVAAWLVLAGAICSQVGPFFLYTLWMTLMKRTGRDTTKYVLLCSFPHRCIFVLSPSNVASFRCFC